MAILEGVLEHFVFCNEENGFCVARVSVPHKSVQGEIAQHKRVSSGGHESNLITVVGNFLGVQPGENIRMQGNWINDKKYGEQFRVDSYTSIKPTTLVGIEKYLGSGMIKGIGPVMASRIVKCFGLETLDVIDNSPQRLTEVEGIGKVRAERIAEAWQEQKEIKDVMLFLQSHGVTTSFAIKIYKQYGNKSIEILTENPYRLAMDVYGIGFKTADKIALNLGIDRESLKRVEAGILHVLASVSDDGHVCYPLELLVEKASHSLEVQKTLVEQAIENMCQLGLVVKEKLPIEDNQYFEGLFNNQFNSKNNHLCRQIELQEENESKNEFDNNSSKDDMRNSLIYLKSLISSEIGVTNEIERILKGEKKLIDIDIGKAIIWFETKYSLCLAEQQKEAIKKAIDSKIMVITGGPGTGKTTLINGIIQILRRKDRKIILAAPTGRAAKRMTEATGIEAKTIHRLLEFSPKNGRFEKNRENQLEADIVIVDEVSMVDIVLFYNLLKAVPSYAQLIIVGDIDQLPSVGPGNVLKDVILSGCVEVVKLNQVFRQAQASLIITNAHRVNSGKMPYVRNRKNESDFFYIEKQETEEILEEIKSLVHSRIPKNFGFSHDKIQVLTPMHRGLLGASNLNKELQEILNNSSDFIVRGSRLFKKNDRVMQVRNNYDLDVFNGDIGKIVSINKFENEVLVDFDGREVCYDYSELDELVLAYACSVHKSQGSEYSVVVMPIHTQHYMMLQRNLLYTAITRAKKLLVIAGSKRALVIAIKNNKIQERYSCLKDRLSLLIKNSLA